MLSIDMLKLPFFSNQKSDPTKFLTVNFNTDNVKCLALYRENGGVKIIGSGKGLIDPGSVRSGNIIAKENVTNALVTAVAEATAELGENINSVIFGISGDLCLGQMTTIKAKRNGEFPISKKEMNNLYARINDAAYIQAQNEYLQITGNSEVNLEIVTSSNVYIKLDNQRVPSLENRHGAVIETAVFNAFVPEFHINTLQNLAKKCQLQIMAIGSEMYALVQTILSSHHDLNDFIAIEVDSDYTNVAVIFGRGIVATKNLNIGYKHFVEGVSERMGLTMREAERVLKSYITGKLTEKEGNIVNSALKTTLEIWLTGLELLFSEYTGVKTFASKIFITGEGADVPELWEIIKTDAWARGVPFKEAPDFEKLTFLDLGKVTDGTGKVASSEWLTTASLSLIYLELEGLLND
ncbi:hypothetical protein A2415_05145 [candidate division WWE3 bacterium RIFOXYC1_FULL_39_7]|uniref:SHS2 domain-containing protein n=2 Tax=Katanobacteria TaxID=422282 RepID=A0A1F4X8E4_UNCKA|nr:MAG: hypothetical protein A2415_05145 [candidate division WWE3 bacterium RIFOXYC1_FULL_39_7]OGC77957.1 MAG: hypothetical protein A2619_00660 [candidate division WWE3 bacterium RIFOXYD1_FULL_39_9]